MQTFVPYPNFYQSAQVLDMKRLGKQRVETLQILHTLSQHRVANGWRNHPAVKMWKHHELALVQYGITICKEWIGRGYKDTCLGKITAMEKEFPKDTHLLPPWWGDNAIHDSHKSKLLQKDFSWYSKYNWEVPLDLEYVWGTP